jgi:hypothetical protein
MPIFIPKTRLAPSFHSAKFTACFFALTLTNYFTQAICETPSAPTDKNTGAAATTLSSINNSGKTAPTGKWHGHLLNKDEIYNVSADFKGANGELQGTITCNGKTGAAKHYISGVWDISSQSYVLKDIGLDIVGNSSNWCPVSFDKYSLNPVDNETKLVGTCHQPDENKTLWMTLIREGTSGTEAFETAESNNSTKPMQFSLMENSNYSPVPSQLKFPNKTERLNSGSAGSVYMSRIEQAVQSRWHPPSNGPARKVSVRFHINDDGSISDIKLDPESGPIDEYVTTSFQAIRACSPFEVPPKVLLDYPGQGNGKPHVTIHLQLDSHSNSKNTPG